MAQHWEIDLYYDYDSRIESGAEADGLEHDTFHGRDVWRKTVEADSYESGASGTVALYYSEDHERMDRVISVRDPDLIAYDSRLMGEPDEPEEPETPDPEDDEWTQEAS